MKKIVHIISGLPVGGAQMMLYRLLSRRSPEFSSAEVISLTRAGVMGKRIRSLGVPVEELRMPRGIPLPQGLLALAGWLSKRKPDIIQTWMYHADLLGSLAARSVGLSSVVWGVHNTDLDAGLVKRRTLWTVKACARLSGALPSAIVFCSEAARRLHAGLGYIASRMEVIPNGFDLQTFRPDGEARAGIREQLGLSEAATLIGLVARYDPQKDHSNFISAAAKSLPSCGDLQFLLCGEGVTWDNLALAREIRQAGLKGRFHLLGLRDDVQRISSALDVACSSSAYGEAFPLAIGEAMACGVPCVVTNVGDSALIVGDTGRVVPPRDADALAAAFREMQSLGRERRELLGSAARKRIGLRFSLEAVAKRYESLYCDLPRNTHA